MKKFKKIQKRTFIIATSLFLSFSLSAENSAANEIASTAEISAASEISTPAAPATPETTIENSATTAPATETKSETAEQTEEEIPAEQIELPALENPTEETQNQKSEAEENQNEDGSEAVPEEDLLKDGELAPENEFLNEATIIIPEDLSFSTPSIYTSVMATEILKQINEHNKIPHILIGGITEEELARPEVEKFRNLYMSEKWSDLLKIYLERAMEYRLYVRKAISDSELPAYLEYLPVVESNYTTNAKSKSGAIGMWQFMENSVYPFLTLNDFVDERLDPWKSTDAAIKKLLDNYKTFGDWYLAIAAYNCGAGAMKRILNKAEEKNFWYLLDHNLLPAQTAEYVPKLIAIADLAVNAEYYGIDLPSHNEEYEVLENEKNGLFDYVTVNKAYSISQLAGEMRMDLNELKRLNPSYTRGMTHPTKQSMIRLPLGMKQSGEDAIAKLEPIDFPFSYKVVAGDSLWSISRKYKVSVQSICDINNIKENDILKIGKTLYIPSK